MAGLINAMLKQSGNGVDDGLANHSINEDSCSDSRSADSDLLSRASPQISLMDSLSDDLINQMYFVFRFNQPNVFCIQI